MPQHAHDKDPSRYVEVVIFATNRDDFEVNAQAFGENFKVLQGSWNGEGETVYLVTSKTFDRFVVGRGGYLIGQESVLILSEAPPYSEGLRRASIANVGPWGNLLTPYPIGDFVPVPREIARAAKSWTYDPSTGQHWLAGVRWPTPAI